MNTFYKRLWSAFYSFMQVQFFLSLASLPLLIAWGLPFSLMSVIGNLIFTPFLSLFLLLSCILFFFELLSLPTGLLIALLEKLFSFWMYCLSFGSTRWLYGIDEYGFFIAIFCFIIAGILLHHRRYGQAKNHWYFSALLLAIPFIYQTARSYSFKKFLITCSKKTALATRSKGKISVFDKGALGEKQASNTWIQYSFLPEVLKKCGCTQFDTITTLNPTTRTLDALIALCNHATINTLIIEHPHHRSSDYRKKWKELESKLKNKKINLKILNVPG